MIGCRAPVDLPKQPPFDFGSRASPVAADFSTEATLVERWGSVDGGAAGPLQGFWSAGEQGSFAGVDGVSIPYRIHRPAGAAKAGVVIIPGRTEAIVKYAEVAWDLVQRGYATYAVTLRGQGEAGRILADPDPGHVAWFDDYVQDSHRFIAEVVRPREQVVFGLGHSTGGAVAVLVNDLFPQDLDALVLSAPALQLDLGAFPPSVAASLALGVCNTSAGTGYVLGSGPWSRESLDPAASTVTSSAERLRWKILQLDADPSLRVGGATWRWLCQVMAGGSQAEAVGPYTTTPVLLLQALSDTVVEPGAQDRYCADAPRCTLSAVPGAKHELLMERDVIRNEVMVQVVRFLDAQVQP